MKSFNIKNSVLRFFVTSRLVAIRGLGSIFTVLFFAGCGAGNSDVKLVVVSTTTHVTDIVKFVAGDGLNGFGEDGISSPSGF